MKPVGLVYLASSGAQIARPTFAWKRRVLTQINGKGNAFGIEVKMGQRVIHGEGQDCVMSQPHISSATIESESISGIQIFGALIHGLSLHSSVVK
jgi:hypothetical protein